MSDNPPLEQEALQTIISLLSGFDKEVQERIVRTVVTFFDLDAPQNTPSPIARGSYDPSREISQDIRSGAFSDREEKSVKEFMLEKDPRTNVERVACLAYYLTHYRDMTQFKTLDLSKLNVEAAQPKFTNTAVAVNDATVAGLLNSTTRGRKQLSVIGEQFVQALPDREAAKAALKRMRPRTRKTRKSARSKKSSKGRSELKQGNK